MCVCVRYLLINEKGVALLKCKLLDIDYSICTVLSTILIITAAQRIERNNSDDCKTETRLIESYIAV